MKFKFFIGTKAIFGANCVKENKDEFARLGKRAMIVTGKSSAKKSGALQDVIETLEEMGISYIIFDKIENNPSMENVKEGGIAASKFNAHFIIGIGGGSPLDAAKAIAVLAVNDIEPVELFKNEFSEKPLPIVAIPTTAGTGSEVTPYSILTRKDMETKMSFGNQDTFPQIALLDAKYTQSLPYDITIDTAIDALSHSVEGYLSKKSSESSDIFAVESVSLFGECLANLISNNIDYNIREKLLYMAMLGGMVISHTGTTIVHGMGYSLTYFKDIPHGRANGLLMKEYFKFNYDHAGDKIGKILGLLGLKSIDEFGGTIDRLLQIRSGEFEFTDIEIELFTSLAMKQRSTLNNIKIVREEDMIRIYKCSLEKYISNRG